MGYNVLNWDGTESAARSAARRGFSRLSIAVLLGGVHSSIQHPASREAGNRAAAAFLSVFDNETDEGRRGTARLLSAACGPASAWLTALQGAPSTRLGDEDFVYAARHLLGLGAPMDIADSACFCGASDAAHPDHAMACKLCAGMITLRHDDLVSTWRRIIRRSGCATSAEPPYRNLQAHGRFNEAVGLRRGDILAVLPSKMTVLDCVVTHPAAASLATAASKRAGAAAAKAEQGKRREFQEFGDGAGYDFVPLAVESFGRLGLAASRFLSALGDVAESRGAEVSKARFVRHARQELSCALVRGNGRVYRKHAMQLARAAGVQFTPGLDQADDSLG